VALEQGPGGAVGGVRGFGVFMVEALLEAAPDGGEDGFGRRALWWLSTRDCVIGGVGRTAGAVDLEQQDGVEEAPCRLKVLPLL